MKRRVVLILLLLVAGAIVNVAVAWGCVFLPPPLFDVVSSRRDMRLMTHDEVAAFLSPFFPDVQFPAHVPGMALERFGGARFRASWLIERSELIQSDRSRCIIRRVANGLSLGRVYL